MSNWVQHALDRTNLKPQQQAAWLIVLGVIMTLTFGGISLSQIANYASTNRAIEDLIAERDRLERENEALRANIANLQTMPRLIERARELGFVRASGADIEYLTVEGYNPDRADTVVELPEFQEVDDTPQYNATFAGWLQQHWDSITNQFRAFGR